MHDCASYDFKTYKTNRLIENPNQINYEFNLSTYNLICLIHSQGNKLSLLNAAINNMGLNKGIREEKNYPKGKSQVINPNFDIPLVFRST